MSDKMFDMNVALSLSKSSCSTERKGWLFLPIVEDSGLVWATFIRPLLEI